MLAAPGRRYGDFVELLAPLHAERFEGAATETLGELEWNGNRLIVTHDPERAAERGAKRWATIAALEAQAATA